ncbi:MAG: hypothetical protein ABIN13_11295 [Mucilaginibacter sp.]
MPKINATLKIGASNLLNTQISQAYGSPTIGGIYYAGITFDNLFVL